MKYNKPVKTKKKPLTQREFREKYGSKKAIKKTVKSKKRRSYKDVPLMQWPLKKLVKEADRVFSLWIRNRDGLCVQRADGKCTIAIDNGHLIKRGKMPVRWSEINCNAQCKYHNQLHNFEPWHYTAWFVEKYGDLAYTDMVAESLEKWSSAQVRNKAIEVIEKYQLKQEVGK